MCAYDEFILKHYIWAPFAKEYKGHYADWMLAFNSTKHSSNLF